MFTCFSCIAMLSIMSFLLISCNNVDAVVLHFFLWMKCRSIHLVRCFIVQMFVLSSYITISFIFKSFRDEV